MPMQRVTISLDEDLALAFDALAAEQGYQSRSEAMRDLVRRAVDARRLQAGENETCVANLSYVFDHHTRDLARRLTDIQHDRHDLVISSTHVHLDHESCLESTMLKGPISAVRGLCDAIQAERGVRFAAVNLVSMAAQEEAQRHTHTHDGIERP
jgi:CopG family nickel-responsive transcriptional regulator